MSFKIDRTDTILFLGGITALAAISIDIILPATGVIARDFGLADQFGASLVGFYFLSYAIGQLFWGLFSDAYGRKFALGLSLLGFSGASIACAVATDFNALLGFRFLQGLMCGAPVVARAIVRDTSSGKEAAQTMASLSAILTVATLIAPVIGSGLLVLTNWRAIFAILVVLSLVFLVYILLRLPETAGIRRPERFRLKFVLSAGRNLLGLREFVSPMLVSAFTFGGYAAILSVGAIVAETRYEVSPGAFGSIFALAALTNTAGILLAKKLLKKRSLKTVSNIAMAALVGAGIVQFIISFMSPSLLVFWGSVCLYVLAFGLTYPVASASAMEPAGDSPGFASSLLGSCGVAMGTFGTLVATALFDGTHTAVSITMALFAGFACAAFIWGRRRPDAP
ncbi:MFS transporter [Cochlodiniinecator piscidefendens]|uniref:MFS transporter n=1 Tax=Cochlodiniinecator piscidefendens TaxID=2715756 RepID=UPI00140781E9|nr:MFS transporter [Cochlodiniinecator piscidefendens]